MKVIADGLALKIAKVTGPAHNFLGFEFAYVATATTFEDMNSKTPASTANEIREIIVAALNGVGFENPLHGKLYLKKVLFDGLDTPDKATYEALIITLSEYAKDNLTETREQ
ncbi:hypothetical protein [Candidatus Thiothrix anitrata]|uniref:Phage protein n=1 Tax=Candidatus Thiothrix anitrata TaxID=2823902 RepID=A0ABX7WZB9_9GAMM|nr:hypothetical protein [Candidatus Thiothrix anitrata]QTR48982.1 hypothetical protein J8380_11930 [Candidatus Thiothrix anitrata]